MSTPAAPRIALLPEVVQNQIAAGEVIERPASVVKELVENALDAGATSVQVDLAEGGARLVRVTDDGSGMVRADLELAFEPHATSKLRTPEDLDHIASLGFRGEALASIASVARCSLFSRPRAAEPDAPAGARVEVEGGRRRAVREAAGAPGTIVEVRDLFFNTPARRRFLKRTSTELAHCLDVLQRTALANVGVGFVVTHDGKRVYDVEARMDLAARLRRTFGAELAEALVPVSAEDGTTRVFGFVAPPRFSRRDTTRQMWFLNGRPLRDKVLTRAVREGYRGFLVEGRQPVAFLGLALDPSAVDVNVHPAKAEVRFREQRRVFGFLVAAVRAAVRKTDMATPGETLLASRDRRLAGGRAGGLDRATVQPSLPAPGPLPRARAPRAVEEWSVREVEGEPFEIPRHAPSQPAAAAAWERGDGLAGPYLQIARTYIVRAVEDGFEIVDQHALHERLTFELLRREVREGRVEVQGYLVPELVELSRADAERLEEHLPALARIGIELARFGDTTVAVNGLPARMKNPDAEGLVRDVVDVLARTGRPPGAEDVAEELLHRAACRSSVMAGDELTQEEMHALLARGRGLETDQTCPHARPTRVRFHLADLEKAFHRR